MSGFVLEQSRAKRYALQDSLGSGAFASVFKVMDRDTNTVYALKVVKLTGSAGVRVAPGGLEVPAEDIEVKLMECLQKTSSTTGFCHPNIIELKEHWKQDDDKTLCMMLEFCGSPLSDGINEGKYQYDIDRILGHLSSALYFCEERHVLHLDIKPENVLVRESSQGNNYKLADFGLSHFRDNLMSSMMSAVGGTDQFKAPETTGRKKLFSSKADVWATGLTLHWVIYKRFAFWELGRFLNIVEIRELLQDDPDYLTIPPSFVVASMSPSTRDAINLMLAVNVESRASPSELARLLGLVLPPTTAVRSAREVL
jgi:serine/threonine protein kinase